MADLSGIDHEHEDLKLAGEAIRALLWLVQEIVDESGVALDDEAADVINRVDQIGHLLR